MKRLTLLFLLCQFIGTPCLALSEDLTGMWQGTQHNGDKLTFEFTSEKNLFIHFYGTIVPDISSGVVFQYQQMLSSQPPRLYLQVYKNNQRDKLLPLGIYRLYKGKLELCFAGSFEASLGLPANQSRYDFPDQFGGPGCVIFQRQP